MSRMVRYYGLTLLLSVLIVGVTPPLESVAQIHKIYIDIGHGGSGDPGTVGNGFPECREADVNLSVGLELFDILTFPPILGLNANDYEFTFSRLSDSAIEPRPRARDANEYGASIFVSIHHNGSVNTSVQRIETLYSSPVGRNLYGFDCLPTTFVSSAVVCCFSAQRCVNLPCDKRLSGGSCAGSLILRLALSLLSR